MVNELPSEKTKPFLTPREAAHYLRLSESTLAKLRAPKTRHQGPRFSKLCGSIRYRRADLDAWVAQNAMRRANAGPPTSSDINDMGLV